MNPDILIRLEILLDALDLSKKAFAEKILLSPQQITEIFRDTIKNLTPQTLELLKIKFGLNLDWLLSGEGEMFMPESEHQRLTPEEKELVELYRSSDADSKRLLMASARGFAVKWRKK